MQQARQTVLVPGVTLRHTFLSFVRHLCVADSSFGFVTVLIQEYLGALALDILRRRSLFWPFSTLEMSFFGKGPLVLSSAALCSACLRMSLYLLIAHLFPLATPRLHTSSVGVSLSKPEDTNAGEIIVVINLVEAFSAELLFRHLFGFITDFVHVFLTWIWPIMYCNSLYFRVPLPPQQSRLRCLKLILLKHQSQQRLEMCLCRGRKKKLNSPKRR